MTPKRISFALPGGLGIGGSNLWSLQVGQALARRGWRSSVLVHRGFDNSPRLNPADWPDVQVVDVPGGYPGKARIWDIWRYTRTYRQVLPGIIVPNWSEGTYAACARLVRRHGRELRVIGIVHGMNPGQRAIAIKYERICSTFIAVSAEIADCLRAALPHRAEDIVVRSCPVEVPETLDRAWSMSGPLRLVYAGRVTNYEKKVSRLIPLAEKLVAAGVSFVMDIYGDGGYMRTLRHEHSRATEAVQRAVTIHGQVAPNLMPAIWRKADVCLLVSDSEGSPLCVMEAMAHGGVPVAMRVSGVPALVEDGVTGWSVNVGDLDGMVSHIEDIDQNRSRMEIMGRAAHNKIRQSYSLQFYVPWFEALLRQLDKPVA